MSELIKRASNLLNHMYDADRGLFSYSTTFVDGKYENVFDHPKAQRYTINTLAGLWRVAQYDSSTWNFDETLESFLNRQSKNITDPGDTGLLLYVLSQCKHPQASKQFAKVKRLTSSKNAFCSQVLQDACWQLYGLIAYARRFDDKEAHNLATSCMTWLQQRYMNPDTGFPYHESKGFRKRFVSFGGITYFLKAMFEYASAFDDDNALNLFKKGVSQIIARQGANGEWAWFYNAETGDVMDWYEVYSVHQEAMAMLFLLPALDSGMTEARDAIIKSVAWLFGANELDSQIMTSEPFFSYRSIRRKGPLQRSRRFARSLVLAASGRRAELAAPQQLELNTECRSYEMGWTLYAWAGRRDFSEFTGLRDNTFR